jgi:hypothetical protein
MELFSQHVQQARHWKRVDAAPLTVHYEVD